MAVIPNSQKTFSVNEGVNTTYGGSAAMKALSQWYTMQDITDTVRPYQVYTALLTQSGGDNVQYKSSGLLTIGTTYTIFDNIGNPDFTNVGAPNNNNGTYFVATGITPNSWGDVGDASVLQYNTGAPVVTVLENTIGDIWFNYGGAEGGSGCYGVNSNNLFNDKTIIFSGNKTGTWDSLTSISSVNYSNSSFDLITVAGTNNRIDDVLNNTPIEIRVYN
jgi:hypothetical protein